MIEGYACHAEDSAVTLAELKAKLLETGLQTAMRANADSHPQYAGCQKQVVPVDELIAKKHEQKDEDSVYLLRKNEEEK